MFQSISPTEAAELIQDPAVVVLDVRTPQEYEQLGHIPGAWLLPVDLIASAPAILPDERCAVMVYCEHGVRSVAAARWLESAGIADVVNMSGGMSRWSGPREYEPGRLRGPSRWLLDNADLLPRGGRVLDVAAGRGRHALLLGAAGFPVHAIDRDAAALASIERIARAAGIEITTETCDLESGDVRPVPAAERERGRSERHGVSLGENAYDAIVVFNYLHRPLFPAIAAALKPGGVLFYETFLIGQAERGHPKNPAFLLQPGELQERVLPLTMLRTHEGEVDGNLVASIVAKKI